LVNILQGEIAVHSELNVGTTVEVSLSAEAAAASAVECEMSNTPSCNNCNVLAVDDDVALLTMLGELLHDMGSTVVLCKNWQEFEEQLPHLSSFDLALTDRNMGATSGKDILQKVREISSSIPVFVMTAYGDYSLEKALADGFSGYLAKPFSLHSLAGLLGKQQENCTPVNLSGNDFSELLAMFNNDRAAVQDILKIFAENTVKHIGLLQQHISDDNFDAAQTLCHKMLPMFAQLGENDLAAVLKKMDLLREKNAKHFPQWKEELTKFIKQTANLLEKVDEFL
jgi:CheY-like chemotaxis protein